MAINTIEAFYLGIFSDLDPDESDFQAEGSSSLLGLTFGGPGAPLYDSIDTLSLDDENNDGSVKENDNGQTGEDLIYEGVRSTLDSVIDYNVTVTYSDGTTATTRMGVVQDEMGRLFLRPFSAGSPHNAVLDDKPIESIKLDSVVGDNFIGNVTTTEQDAFIDGDVDGTAGDDAIGTSYTDADGTQMNAYGGDDTVDAGAGDDTIAAGAGDDSIVAGTGNDSVDGGGGLDTIIGGEGADTISGGDGADLIHGDAILAPGQTEYLVEGYIKGENFTLNNDHFSSANDTVFTTDGPPIQIRFVDNDANMDADSITNETPDDTDGLVEINGELYNFAADYQAQFSGSDGQTYEFIVVDVDLDRDGQFTESGGRYGDFVTDADGDLAIENGQILIPVGTPPPAGVQLTATGVASLVSSTPYSSLYGYQSNVYDDSIDGGAGNDTVFGGAGADTISGGTGADSLEGGDDADTFIVQDGFGNDTIDGGEGGTDSDTLDLSGLTSPVTVTYTGDEAGTISDGTDTISFSGIENLVLTDQADLVDGTADTAGLNIDAGGGDDTVTGGRRNDTISGNAGNDSIDAGMGDDSVDGGAGNDTIDGGALPDRQALEWSEQGASGTDIGSGFTQNTGDMDITVTHQGFGGDPNSDATIITNEQYVEGDEGINAFSGLFLEGTQKGTTSKTTLDFAAAQGGLSDEVENVVFRLNDVDNSSFFTDSVTILAYDADGNAVPVTLSQPGANDPDNISGSTVTASGGGDNPTSVNGSVLVEIAGPVSRIEIFHGNSGSQDAIHSVFLTDVHFDPIATTPETDDDTLTGGDGDDVFVVGDGHDTITDFNAGNSGAINDGDTTNNDFVDLSGHYDSISELYADQADDGILNQSNSTDSNGNAVDYSDNTRFGPDSSLTFQGASADNSTFTAENTGVACFTSGTAILTPRGEVLIDDLRRGDVVCTLDNGPKPILWIGSRYVSAAELAAHPQLRPIRICAGALGARIPAQDLIVSPQHRILIRSRIAVRMFDAHEVLIAAKHLLEIEGIEVAKDLAEITFYHFLFDQHEIVIAHGAEAESLFTGPQSLKSVSSEARKEIFLLFPQTGSVDCPSPTARQIVSRKRASTLAQRHRRNGHPLVTSL